MTPYSLENPVFRVYVVAAAVVIVKMGAQAWITVYRMVRVNGGFRSPEDLAKTLINRNPAPDQLAPNDWVERSRRVHANDSENIPLFLVAGLLLVAASPPLWVAQVVLYGYAASRLLHSLAYLTAQIHDVRAALWTPGSLAVLGMATYAGVCALTW